MRFYVKKCKQCGSEFPTLKKEMKHCKPCSNKNLMAFINKNRNTKEAKENMQLITSWFNQTNERS